MSRARPVVFTLLAVTLAFAVGAAEERAGWDFKSRQALAAKKKLDELIAKAEEDYFRRVGVARELAAKELTDAMRSVTKAGDFDEANRIKQALDELSADPPAPGAGKGLVGSWELRYTNAYRRTYEVNPDGTVTWTDGGRNGRGKLQREGGGWLLPEDGSGNAERWTLAGDRVFIEHFVPKARYGKEPAQFMAVGERAGRKRK